MEGSESTKERQEKTESSEAMDVDQSSSVDPPPSSDNHAPSTTKSHDPAEPEAEWVGHLRSVDNILSGEKTVALHQEFLIRNNHTDLQILKNTKVYKLQCRLLEYAG